MTRIRGAMLMAAGFVLVAAAPAAASGTGTGTFQGYEDAPAATLYTSGTGQANMCATFTPTTNAPLREVLSLTGTWATDLPYAGTGTAIYKDTSTAYDANPNGTYAANSGCTGSNYAVPGTMTVDFKVATGGTISCNGSATYERTNQSVITITFSGTCTGPSGQTVYNVTATFTGTEVPCGFFPGPDPCTATVANGHDAYLSGNYTEQSS